MNLLYPLRACRDIHGSRPAWIAGDTFRTWRQCYGDIEQSAAWLVSRVERGERIAFLLSNGVTYLELYYATAMSGVVAVPLNIRWSVNECVETIRDCGARALFVDERFAPVGQQILEQLPQLDLVYVGPGGCPAGMIDYRAGVVEAVPIDHPEPTPDQLAAIYYTSGTTGGPKGAMISHRNICSNATLCIASGMYLGTVYIHAAPMFHIADCAGLHVMTFLGGTHVFVEVFDPSAVLAAIERYRVSACILVPAMINMIVNLPDVSRYDLSSLERILYGASPMPLSLLERAMKVFGCGFQQAYGMTETSPVLTILQPDDHRLENLDSRWTPVRSAGRPVLGMEVRVVDAEDRPLTAGQAGEIIARGDNVMLGYWNRPEINREVLRGGWMHTGDVGVFDEDGFLYILDRTKDMIKTGSENVYSPEVEAAIVSHPEVLEAAVIGVPDERWGEAVRAMVVLRPGAVCSESDLIAYCRERLTRFKCPTSVLFLDVLPKNATGKIQKAVLRKAGTA